MSITSIAGVLKIFGGSDPTPEERAELANQVMLMTLARATSSDTNIKAVEIERVIEVLKARTGQEVEATEVRIQAKSAIFEKVPLEKYLSTSARHMSTDDRVATVEALAEVINVDGRVSSFEIDFFDKVANALDLTPSVLMGLRAD